MKQGFQILLFIFLGFTSFMCTAQTIEALKLDLKSERSPEGRLEILNKLCRELDLAYSTDSSSLAYHVEFIKLARQLADSVSVAKGWFYVGWLHYLNDNILLSNKAYQNALQSISLLNDEHDLKAQVYNQLGINYGELQAFNLALKSFKQTLVHLERVGDLTGKAGTLINITSFFKRLNMPDSVKHYAKLSLEAYQKAIANNSDTTFGKEGVGIAYLQMDSTEQAILYLQQALADAVIKHDTVGIASANRYLGYCYYQQNNYAKAKFHLLFFDELSLVRSADVYQYLSDIFLAEHDYKKALHYFQEKTRLNAEAFGPRTREQVFESQQLYQDELRDKAVLAAQNEILRSRQYIYLLISFLVIVSLALLFILTMYKQKRDSEKKLTTLNKEIETRNEEITAQAEKLKEVNEKIVFINKNLDKLVQDRTAIIEHQKAQIEHFAFMNAHEIRGPLSTMLGLINIIESENLLEDSNEIQNYLRKTAVKMDEIIHSVQDKLNNEDWKKIEIDTR